VLEVPVLEVPVLEVPVLEVPVLELRCWGTATGCGAAGSGATAVGGPPPSSADRSICSPQASVSACPRSWQTVPNRMRPGTTEFPCHCGAPLKTLPQQN
jgi:hypothetical protein